MALFVSVFGSRGIFVMLCVEVVCCVRVTDRCGCCIVLFVTVLAVFVGGWLFAFLLL